MIRLQHLLHPIRAVRYAQTTLAARRHMRMAPDRDCDSTEYATSIRGVTDGFAPRLENACDDTHLLQRICASYIKATESAGSADGLYSATTWWRSVRQHGLTPVRYALKTRNVEKLGAMYRNFFRDACGTGLVPRPPGGATACFNGRIGDLQARYILAEALHRVDYWKKQTGGRLPLADLCAPAVGNPFGVFIDGVFVAASSEYQHYCAQVILGLINEKPLKAREPFVAEIGGGYGAMAWYLLRGRPEITYLDFDLPESLALTAYYLAKALPTRKLLLYGEAEFTPRVLSDYDTILMPSFELAAIPPKCVDVTFSSHALSDLLPTARDEYLTRIAASTREWFLNIGSEVACEALRMSIAASHPSFSLLTRRESGWNSYHYPEASESEDLFRLTC